MSATGGGTPRTERKALTRNAVVVMAFAALLAVLAAPEASATRQDRPAKLIARLAGVTDATTTLLPGALASALPTAVPTGLPTPDAGDKIGPGSHLLIKMDGDSALYSCTANFVWTDGSRMLLGAAGHCFLPATKTATAGPGADYDPAATHVRVCVSGCTFGGQSGFVLQGTTVTLGPVLYARQSLNGVDVGNDFGLVEIPTALAGSIRKAMPVWGGPKGSAQIGLGSLVCLYGNGIVVGEVFATKARAGIGISSDSTRWSANIPSLPGDSGSAVEVCSGTPAAAGILTHLVGGAGVIAGTTVSRAAQMAADDARLSVSIVNA